MCNLCIIYQRIRQNMGSFVAMQNELSDLEHKVNRLRDELTQAKDIVAKALTKLSKPNPSDAELEEIVDPYLQSVLDKLNVQGMTHEHMREVMEKFFSLHEEFAAAELN